VSAPARPQLHSLPVKPCRQIKSKLLQVMEPAHDPGHGLLRNLHHKELPPVAEALRLLRQLNKLNTKGAKHIGGTILTWRDIVAVHTGIYSALTSLLEAADRSSTK